MKWKKGGMDNMNKKNYFKYLIKKYWKLELVISIVLFLQITLSQVISLLTNDYYYGSIDRYQQLVTILFYITLLSSCAFSCFTPIYLHHHLYRKQSCDLYYSLPMKRKDMYQTHFLYGCLSIIVPMVICYLMTVLCMIVIGGFSIDFTVFELVLFIIVMNLVLQAIITLLSVKSNKLLDAIVATFGFLIIPFVIYLCLGAACTNMVDEIIQANVYYSVESELPFLNHLLFFISLPFFAITNFPFLTQEYGLAVVFTNSSHIIYLCWWIVIGLISYYYGKHTYVQRASEESEQYTSSKMIYPFMIHIGLLSILLVMVQIENDYLIKYVLILFALVGYCVSMFFAMRKIQFKLKYFVTFIVMLIATSVFTMVFQQTSGFGYIQEVPVKNQISEINVSIYIWNDETEMFDYNGVIEKEDISDYYDRCAYIPELCTDGAKDHYKDYGYCALRYLLTDGREIYREYRISTTKAEKNLKQFRNDLIELEASKIKTNN